MAVSLKKFKLSILVVITLPIFSACSVTPPKDSSNLCKIFYEKRDWYEAAVDMKDKWGVPIQIPMSMMYQESSFKEDAQPPMEWFLGFIPTGRASSAYGYSQAKTMTWKDYIKETGNSGADRDDFDDAIDFMGWFISKTHKINGVSKWDGYAQYLNYHEGWGGFRKKSYLKKKWLIKVARKVKARASTYGKQLKGCEADLKKGWFRRLFD